MKTLTDDVLSPCLHSRNILHPCFHNGIHIILICVRLVPRSGSTVYVNVKCESCDLGSSAYCIILRKTIL